MPDEPDTTARADATAHDADTGPDPSEVLRDAVDVVVGLGILAINRVQSVRREVERDRAPRHDASAQGHDPSGGDTPG